MTDAHADVSKHVKLYVMVLVALLIGTVVTVLVAQKDLGGSTNMIVALLIAAVKASLVASIFMHLRWEKSPSIWWPLAMCAIFLITLLLLPLFTYMDAPPGVMFSTWG